MKKRTIVFIHGLWIHASSWKPWEDFFVGHGYDTISPPWPGEGISVAESRVNPDSIANRGVKEVTESYSTKMRTFGELPIVIGHSFGGLIAQRLLGQGLAAAGVAIDPAPMKGVWQLPFSALRASLPVLANPFNIHKAVSLTYSQFRYAFANAVPEKEAKDLYDLWTIPTPAKPLFQAAIATFAGDETHVNTSNATRGPLLITGGEKDHIAPPVLGRASAKRYSPAVITEFKLFVNRGHSLTMDHGWPELAEYIIVWLKEKGF